MSQLMLSSTLNVLGYTIIILHPRHIPSWECGKFYPRSFDYLRSTSRREYSLAIASPRFVFLDLSMR